MDLLPAVSGKATLEGNSPEGAVPCVIFSGNSGERYDSIGASQQGNLTHFVSPVGYKMLWAERYTACSYLGSHLSIAYEHGGQAAGVSTTQQWGTPTVTSLCPLTIVH